VKHRYITSYKAGANYYGSWIYARSLPEAKRIAGLRHMREKIVGEGYKYQHHKLNWRCSDVLRSRQSAIDKLHALTFLMRQALAAKVSTARMFCDEEHGIMHVWIHLEIGAYLRGKGKIGALLIRKVEHIERAIPGYL
jgi:hypothetical protein